MKGKRHENSWKNIKRDKNGLKQIEHLACVNIYLFSDWTVKTKLFYGHEADVFPDFFAASHYSSLTFWTSFKGFMRQSSCLPHVFDDFFPHP